MNEAMWSRDRDLNPRPHPYHGCALPTELSRRPRKYNRYGLDFPDLYGRPKAQIFTEVRDLALHRCFCYN